MAFLRTLAIALLAAGWLLQPTSVHGRSADVVVFAAASLKEAFDDVAGVWRKSQGTSVALSYAASSALARQIEQDAPAHLFVSADLDWMDYVAERKLIRPETRSNLLGNRMVLIAPKESPLVTEIGPGFSITALLGGGRLAMADVRAVPAGKYGKAALDSLGVWTAVERRVAQAENVRAALLLVSRGEAPLGIVYATDAAADPGVKVVGTFPESTHPRIIYPVALTVAGAKHPPAEAFLAFLRSGPARTVFEAKGFTILDTP